MKNFIRLLQLTPVTTGIIAICVAVYAVMVYSGAHYADPHNQALIAWGGNYRPVTINGQGWRLLTAMFVHGGFMHLLMNMVSLFEIGYLLEQKIGRRMLFVTFLLSGLFGGLCSLIWHPLTVGVGASGGIMGLAGALLVWLILPKLERAAEIEQRFLVRGLAVGLTLTLAVGAFSQRIDNAAHAGGLVAGLTLGAIVYVIDRLRSGALKRWAAAILLLIAGFIVLWQQLKAQSPDEYNFRKPLPEIAIVFEDFANVGSYIQRRAAQDDKDLKDFTIDQAGDSFSADVQRRQNAAWLDLAFLHASRGWETCLGKSQSWQKLKLEPLQRELGSQIVSACSLRQRQYQMLRLSLQDQSPVLKRQIQAIGVQARAIEQKMQPEMMAQIQMYFEVQNQLGMSMTGQRRPVPAALR